MELQNLLDRHHWSESDFKYSKKNVEQLIRPQALDNVERLFQHYYRSIGLNTALMILTGCLYFIKPIPEMLIPILLIGLSYLFIVGSMLYYLILKKRPDQSENLKVYLSQTISYNKGVYKFQCESSSLILTTAYVGGFFLGTLLTGSETFDSNKLPVYVFLSITTILFYFFTKTKSFKAINRKLNPNYNKIKSQLDKHLEELTTE